MVVPLGYEFELRTSGTMGSGNIGLIDSGELPATTQDYDFPNTSIFTPYTF